MSARDKFYIKSLSTYQANGRLAIWRSSTPLKLIKYRFNTFVLKQKSLPLILTGWWNGMTLNTT